MELDLSAWMLILFIILLVLSIWKIYAFLPNKALEDDDTTQDSYDELVKLMIQVIKKNSEDIDAKNLYIKITEDENFDKKHFWRFNQNRLNHLLNDLKVRGLVSI